MNWARDYLEYIFSRVSIDYTYYVTKEQEEEKKMKENEDFAKGLCHEYPALVVLLNNTRFRASQMTEILGLDRDAVSKLLSQLLLKGLIRMTTAGLYTPSVSLINIVRKIKGESYE